MRSQLNFKRSNAPIKIFISYSHCDEEYRENLEKHLKILERGQVISIWYDRKILPGESWEKKIDIALNNAEIILLLISADFVNSYYCWDIEVERALQRHSAGEAVVVPILIRSLHGIEHTPFQHLNYIPRNMPPIAEWDNLDRAFSYVASKLEEVLKNYSNIIMESAKNYVWWKMTLDDSLENFPPERIMALTVKLRYLAKDDSINCINRSSGSTCLTFQSAPNSYDLVEQFFSDGKLSKNLNVEITDLSRPVGARLKIETSSTDEIYIDSVVFEKYEKHDELLKYIRFPPFVGGVVYSIDNPISPGFMMYSDQHTKLSNKEMLELQNRLGRYLNTFLAVETKYHYVDLSPTEEYAGLPKPLRITEAGRDLLATDLHLKRTTTQLLHPSGKIGASFWGEMKSQGLLGREKLGSILRLWIVPGKTTLEEKIIDDRNIQANLTGFSLKVECETDFLSKNNKNSCENNEILAIFKDIVLPKVQEQVSAGYSFGLLRQIFSILLISHWFRKKFSNYNIKFIDSNNTQPYSIPGIENEIKEIHNQYLNLYQHGEWRYIQNDIDVKTHNSIKKLIIVGGIVATNYFYPNIHE